MDNSFHNIRNAFTAINNKHAEQDTVKSKSAAKTIYENVESRGSIVTGVKRVHRRLNEFYDSYAKTDDGDEQSGEFYVVVMNPETGPFIGMLTVDNGKWREEQISGREPYKWGTNYSSKLTPEDVMSRMPADYGNNSKVDGPFGTQDAAEEFIRANAGNDSDTPMSEELDNSSGNTGQAVQIHHYGSDDTVGFTVNGADVYDAVVDRFGEYITRDEKSGIMYVPEHMWPEVRQVALNADASDDTDLDNGYDTELDEVASDTATGRINRGSYGTSYVDNVKGSGANQAAPANQITRGRGRPKKAGYDERQAKISANKAAGVGRGRPKKDNKVSNADGYGNKPEWAHFGVPSSDIKLPAWKGKVTKNRLSDKGTEAERVNKIKSNEGSHASALRSLKDYIGEGMTLEAGQHNLESIIQKFKHEVKNFMSTGELDQDLYQMLHEFYMDNGEMPYGIARARTGDPYKWVCEKFGQDLPAVLGGNTPAKEMDESPVNPMDVPAVQRRAAGAAPLTVAQVTGPRSDSMSDLRNMGGNSAKLAARSSSDRELAKLRELAGMGSTHAMEGRDLSEDMSVLGSDQEQDGVSINTNYNSRDGKKSVSITADGAAAESLLQMLKMAGMGQSQSAERAQGTIIMARGGSGDDSDMACMGDDEDYMGEADENYANEPAPVTQTMGTQFMQGDDMNRRKHQDPRTSNRAANPMAEDMDAMGRKLMQQYSSMKIKK